VRIRTVIGVCATSAVMALLAVPAMAQSKPAASSTMTSSSDPVVVGAGISFLHDDGSTATGFAVDVAKDFMHNDRIAIGGVGDFGLNHFDGANVTSYLGGARVSFLLTNPKVKPFAQFLIGAEHCCGETDFATQLGGGVDIAINPKFNFRAQIDFWRHVNVTLGSFNEQRFVFGISMPVGK
jgi:hypothetical protein